MFKKKELEDIDLMSLLDNLIITRDGKRHTIDNYIYELQQERALYKSVIDEVREFIKEEGCYEEDTKIFCDDINHNELPKLLQILDKSKGSEENK